MKFVVLEGIIEIYFLLPQFSNSQIYASLQPVIVGVYSIILIHIYIVSLHSESNIREKICLKMKIL